MPRDSSGNYTLPDGNPVVSGTIIDSNWANPTMSDLGNEITNSLDRNGRGGMLVPFKNIDGDVSAPGITWTNETNTGIYRQGTNDMRASVGSSDTTRWINDSGSPLGEQQPFEIWTGDSWAAALYEGGPAGVLPALSNDTFLKSANFAGDGFVDLIKANTSDEIELGADTLLSPVGTIRQFTIGMSNTAARMRQRDWTDAFSITTNTTQANSQDDITMASWLVQFGDAAGNDLFRVARSPANEAIVWVDALRIDANGNVLVGSAGNNSSLSITDGVFNFLGASPFAGVLAVDGTGRAFTSLVNGWNVHGKGSVNDYQLLNWAATVVMRVPTGTLDLVLAGNIIFDGILPLTITFPEALGDKVIWHESGPNGFATGVEGGTLYNRSPTFHRWYLGVDADGGVSSIMDLSVAGGLELASGPLVVEGHITAGGAEVARQVASYRIGASGALAMLTTAAGNATLSLQTGVSPTFTMIATATGLSIPTGDLEIANFNFGAGAGSQFSLGLRRSDTSATATTNHNLFYNPNGNVGSITTNGINTGFNTSSDPMLKTEFEEITDALDSIEEAHDAGAIGLAGFLVDPDNKYPMFDGQWMAENQPNTGGVERTEERSAAMDYGKRTPLHEAAIYELLSRVKGLEGRLAL